MKHTLLITLDSEKAALFLKAQIEDTNPLLSEDSIRIVKQPEIKMLSEVIEDMKEKGQL